MAMDHSKSKPALWVGALVLLVILALIGLVLYGAYSYFFKPPPPAPTAISLSAYFGDADKSPVLSGDSQTCNDSLLWIRGKVYQSGQPVSDGSVRLTAKKQDETFDQSIFVDLK